jgi:hypothetical protein
MPIALLLVVSYFFATWRLRGMLKKGRREAIRPFLRWKLIFDAAVLLCVGILYALSDAWWMAVVFLPLSAMYAAFVRNPDHPLMLYYHTWLFNDFPARSTGHRKPREQVPIEGPAEPAPDAAVTTLSHYLSVVTERLTRDGFSIIRNTAHKGILFQCIAKRTKWQSEFSAFTTTAFMFAEFDSLDTASLRAFSKTCFRYASRYKGIPLPRATGYAVICFPVALVSRVDDPLSEAIRTKTPPMHWCAHEMPVIIELSTGRLYYFEKTPLWGKFYWSLYRLIIEDTLSPP